MVSECAPTRRFPIYLASGRLAAGGSGKEGPPGRRCCCYHPPWQLLRWRLGWNLPGRTAAAEGFRGIWLAISRMLSSVAISGATWLTVSDLSRKKSGMERSGLAFHLNRWPSGSGRGEVPAVAAECLYCWTAAGYVCEFVRVYIRYQNVRRLSGVESTPPFYLAVSGRLACGRRGKRDRGCYYCYLLWQLLRPHTGL